MQSNIWLQMKNQYPATTVKTGPARFISLLQSICKNSRNGKKHFNYGRKKVNPKLQGISTHSSFQQGKAINDKK